MAININYQAILGRIKEVSEIDTEIVKFVHKKTVSYPGGYDPIRKVPVGPQIPVDKIEEVELLASVDRLTGISNRFDASGRSLAGKTILTIHESELVKAGYDPYTSDWYPLIDYFVVGSDEYILMDKDSIIPETLNGVVYEVIFHLTKR